METFTRTVAIPAVSDFTITELYFNWPRQVIAVTLTGAAGNVLTHQWTGTTATTLMTALNKANLSTANNSLQRRTIQRLIDDGVLTGTIAGSPD